MGWRRDRFSYFKSTQRQVVLKAYHAFTQSFHVAQEVLVHHSHRLVTLSYYHFFHLELVTMGDRIELIPEVLEAIAEIYAEKNEEDEGPDTRARHGVYYL